MPWQNGGPEEEGECGVVDDRVQDGNAAIHYWPQDFSTESGKPMGRHAAGEGFLTGFARHARADALYCHAVSQDHAERFFRQVEAADAPKRPVHWVPMGGAEGLAAVGCLFTPGPNLRNFAFMRRIFDQRGFSLCGIIHTIASTQAMDALASLLMAPIQPWDALICTSNAGRAAVERQLHAVGEYLAERTGGRPPALPYLPTIPLGVDSAAFTREPRHRAAWRARLGIGEGDVAALFVGRLSAHAKANPDPMYLALERAARRSGRKLHLIQAGWFYNAAIEKAFRAGAAAFAPSVVTHFVTPLEGAAHREIWSVADFFVSLSDNIQETFGLTPVEAMAAGLPAVVSDWNGYRDTVRDGIDGFRIPTIAASPGAGGDLALRYALELDRYDLYIGQASQFVAIDVEACADAFLRLIEDAELRARMGESGRRRAREMFDWATIVPAYQALWADLAEKRRAGGVEIAPPRADAPADPWRLDPFLHFAGYASRAITPDMWVRLAPDAVAALAAAYASPVNSYALKVLPTLAEAEELCRLLAEAPAWRAAELILRMPAARHPFLFRGLAWLAKYGVVSLHEAREAER